MSDMTMPHKVWEGINNDLVEKTQVIYFGLMTTNGARLVHA